MQKKENEKIKNIINDEIKQEIKGYVESQLSVDKGKGEEIIRSIIFDGRQYSVRIPQKFADAINIDQNKDKIKFVLDFSDSPLKPKLIAELIRNE